MWAFKYNKSRVKFSSSVKICSRFQKMEEENIYLCNSPPGFLLLIIRSQLVHHSQAEWNYSIFQFQMISYQKVKKNLFTVKHGKIAHFSHIYNSVTWKNGNTCFLIDFAGRMARKCRFLQLLCLLEVHLMWRKIRRFTLILGTFTPFKTKLFLLIWLPQLHISSSDTKSREEWGEKSECLQQEMYANTKICWQWNFRTISALLTCK